jgi:diguanylate cyclase (GGDEF)-like protein
MTLSDITKYKQETENIKEIAMIDELTTLYNRKKLDFIKKDLLEHYLSMIIFDIDDFKMINDTYGHLKGDEVLRVLSQVTKNNLRESDLIIRWGGEEFLILLKDVFNKNVAINLAEKLKRKINEINIKDIGHFSCSFGVSSGFISNKKDLDDILDKADKALYKAKEKGKNRVEVI